MSRFYNRQPTTINRNIEVLEEDILDAECQVSKGFLLIGGKETSERTVTLPSIVNGAHRPWNSWDTFSYVGRLGFQMSTIASIRPQVYEGTLQFSIEMTALDTVAGFRINTAELIRAGALDSCIFVGNGERIDARKVSEGHFSLERISREVNAFTLQFQEFWYSHVNFQELRRRLNSLGNNPTSNDIFDRLVSFGSNLRRENTLCFIHYRGRPMRVQGAQQTDRQFSVQVAGDASITALQFVNRRRGFLKGKVTIQTQPELHETLARFHAAVRTRSVIDITNQAFLISNEVRQVTLFTQVDNPDLLSRIRMRFASFSDDLFVPLQFLRRYAEVTFILPRGSPTIAFYVDGNSASFPFRTGNVTLLQHDRASGDLMEVPAEFGMGNDVLISYNDIVLRGNVLTVRLNLEAGRVYKLRISNWRRQRNMQGFHHV